MDAILNNALVLGTLSCVDGITIGTDVNANIITPDVTGDIPTSSAINMATGANSNNANAVTSGSLTLQTGSVVGTGTGITSGSVVIETGQTPATSAANNASGSINIQTGGSGYQSGDVTISTGMGTNIDTGFSGAVTINTGAVTGTANSGLIQLVTGSIGTGTQGGILLVDGSQGTSGSLWASKDTNGTGTWIKPPSTSSIQGYLPAVSNAGTVSFLNPLLGTTMFDDFVTGATNVNLNLSVLGWEGVSTAGGVLSGLNAGSVDPGVANRIGLLGMSTGVTSNSTGMAAIDLQTWQTYCGQAAIISQWSAMMPTTLSTAGVEYVIEMGFGDSVTGSPGAINGIILQYKRTTSTNFSAYTSKNSVQTSITTADTTDFAVVAGTWYNFMIVMNSAGTQVDFYVAKIGSPYVLLGSSTTNLPDITHQVWPTFTIYKASSTTTAREFIIDWAKYDVTFNSTR